VCSSPGTPRPSIWYFLGVDKERRAGQKRPRSRRIAHDVAAADFVPAGRVLERWRVPGGPDLDNESKTRAAEEENVLNDLKLQTVYVALFRESFFTSDVGVCSRCKSQLRRLQVAETS